MPKPHQRQAKAPLISVFVLQPDSNRTILCCVGDDRLRQGGLFRDCKPRCLLLVNQGQHNKCQRTSCTDLCDGRLRRDSSHRSLIDTRSITFTSSFSREWERGRRTSRDAAGRMPIMPAQDASAGRLVWLVDRPPAYKKDIDRLSL